MTEAFKITSAEQTSFRIISPNLKGDKGDSGDGLISGGTEGQVLAKIDETDLNVEWITVDKTFVGLGNCDNTSDLDKPISTATQAAIDAIQGGGGTSDLALGESSTTAYRGDRGKVAYDHSQLTSGNPHNVTKTNVGLGNCNNTSDINKPISTATQSALNSKADLVNGVVPIDQLPTSISGLDLGETSATAYRGDRGKLAYDHSQLTSGNPHSVSKTDLSIENVDNTSDLLKPISTATQDALDLKADLEDGKVPTSQLPDVFMTIEEYADFASFPETGESNTYYKALDTGYLYLWSGTEYTQITGNAIGDGAALTKTDDSNVTLTLTGNTSIALLQAINIAAGWTGQLGVARGGTGAAALTSGYLTKGNGTNPFTSSIVYDNGTGIGIGTAYPQGNFHVQSSGATGASCYISSIATSGNVMSAFVLGGSNIPTTDAGAIYYTKSSYTTSGLLKASAFYLDCLDTGGLWLGSRNASGKVHFFSGGMATSNEDAQLDSTGLIVGGTSRTRNIVNYVQEGKFNAVYKTQSISLAASTKPPYISGMTDLGGTSTIVPCNYTALNFTSTDGSFSWYNTYHSRVYIAPGAGGEPRISSAYGTQFTGFVHEIECKGKSQDLSAVFHSVYIHGQSAGERAETTGFYYNHMVGGNPWATYNANEGLGKYYDTIIEGQQYIIASAASGSAGAGGWHHMLCIRDTIIDPIFDKYIFIKAHNGVKSDFTGFDPDYDSHSGAIVLSASGKWNKLIGVHADYIYVPLKIQECAVDLYTNVTYNSYLPAIKISKNSFIDMCGEVSGHYYIGASNAGNNDSGYIGIIAGGVAVTSFSAGQVNITGNLVATGVIQAPLIYSTSGLGIDGPLYFGPTNNLKIGLQLGGDNYIYVGYSTSGTYVNIGGSMKRLSVDGSGFVKAS